MLILKKILKILAILILAIAAIGLIFFPSHIHVERSTTINQKQAVVFNYVNDLGNWNNWSPWYLLDTTAKYTFEGPKSGKGAIIKWESESKDVGKGRITISETKPDSLIRQDLNFMEEEQTAKSYFRFTPDGESTKVDWGFDVEAGVNPLLRIMGSFMKDYVGKDFEKGLTRLKSITEAIPSPDSTRVE